MGEEEEGKKIVLWETHLNPQAMREKKNRPDLEKEKKTLLLPFSSQAM